MRMNTVYKQIFLVISDYYVCVKLHSTEQPELVERFIRNVLGLYIKHYQVEFSRKPDLTIHINLRTIFQLLNPLPSKMNYLPLFNKLDASTVETYYDTSFVQFNCLLLHCFNEYLMHNKGFFLHASANLNEQTGEVFIFTGHQTAGKSTIAALLGEVYPILADDGVLIKKTNHGFRLHPNPLLNEFGTNLKLSKYTFAKSYAIKACFFLEKSTNYQLIEEKNKSKIYTLLMEQIKHVSDNQTQAKKQFASLNEFLKQISFFTVCFGKNKSKLRNLFAKI